MANFTSTYTGTQIDDGVRPYKVYVALLTQSSTDAPTAVVLENTLGETITWARSAEGVYTGTCSGSIFLIGKTMAMIGVKAGVTDGIHTSIGTYRNTDSVIIIYTIAEVFGPSVELNDTEMTNTPIEIRVYA